jgi:hypothetical protein
MWKRALIPTLACGTLALIALRPWEGLRAQPPQPDATSLFDLSVRTILIRYGVTDKVEKTWRGRLEPDSGDAKVLSVAGLHFQQSDRITGREWEFKTRLWETPTRQVDLSPGLNGPRPIFPNGVYASVSGTAGARFRLETGAGSFPIALADLSVGKMLTFADGNIEAELVPAPVKAGGDAGQADFPSLAVNKDGRIAVAFQEFLGDRDRLVLRLFSPDATGAATIDSAETHDIFRPAVAYDGAGILHMVWSGQKDGNWDLWEARHDGEKFAPVERLTDAPQPDIHQKMVAASNGDVWLAWQGFRNGQSDIFLKRWSQGKWGPEIKVSESPANDWEPALAAAPDGTVWVGWDSYDHGDYDIFVRSFRGTTSGPVRQVTRSARFEAHASLACDKAGRLWVAYDEAEANWGKDYGYLFKDRGNPLYQSRRIRFARLSADRMEEPAAPLQTAFPLAMPDFLQYPQIAFTPDGQLLVVALQLTHANRVIEVWGSGGVWENVVFTLDGAGWARHRVLPQSAGAHDIRAAVATAPGGAVYAAWAADGRNFTAAAPRHQTVEIARIDRAAGGEIATRSFTEEPELAFPTHPAEVLNLRTVRNYRITRDGREHRILRGDLHRHTSLSGDGVGDGSLWDFYRYVLDAAGMDFSTVTDHQGGATDYNWWKSQKSTDLFHLPGRLTAIYAYERSVLYPNGHRNIVFAKRGVPILKIDPAENQNGRMRSADVVLPYLRQYNAIAFRHTTATNQGTDWRDHNNELEPLVEIFQGHRVVYEHEGGPHGATAEKLYMQRSGYQPAGFVWNALAKGYRVGFEASSDHCSTHISYSCVISESSTREALIEAMRKHHTYGATDNIVLDFRVKAEAREFLQGDEVDSTGHPYNLTVNVIGTGPIRRIDVIHNESYAYTQTPTGKSAYQFAYVDPHPVKGENRYYVRVMQEDGALAWSSPVWVKY